MIYAICIHDIIRYLPYLYRRKCRRNAERREREQERVRERLKDTKDAT